MPYEHTKRIVENIDAFKLHSNFMLNTHAVIDGRDIYDV